MWVRPTSEYEMQYVARRRGVIEESSEVILLDFGSVGVARSLAPMYRCAQMLPPPCDQMYFTSGVFAAWRLR